MTDTMPAVAYSRPLPITDPESLEDVELPVPTPGPFDLLVRVEAVSVNPADVKLRVLADPQGEPRVLGYDAAGVVTAVGADVTMFTPGDRVYYAGSVTRNGTNSRFHVVDERVVGHMPTSLSFAEAAALPLTAITAHESLFDRFSVREGDTGTLLVLGGAGGVGAILIQLARALTTLTVVATASRPESVAYARDMGAHHVIGHDNLVGDLKEIAPEGVDYIFSPFTEGRIETFAEILRPRGAVTAIDDPPGLDLLPLKPKCISFHWELMFSRPMFQTADMITQHEALERLTGLIDSGVVRTTLTETLSPFNAATMRRAHELVESGRTIGKIVVVGF